MQAEYAADKPNDCRFCYFWKNDSTGCSLGKDNCYYADVFRHMRR